MATLMSDINTGTFTNETIADAVKAGVAFFRRSERLDVQQADVARIQTDLAARFNGAPTTEFNRKLFIDRIAIEMAALVEARDEKAIGATAVMDGKLHPIEDEV